MLNATTNYVSLFRSWSEPREIVLQVLSVTLWNNVHDPRQVITPLSMVCLTGYKYGCGKKTFGEFLAMNKEYIQQ